MVRGSLKVLASLNVQGRITVAELTNRDAKKFLNQSNLRAVSISMLNRKGVKPAALNSGRARGNKRSSRGAVRRRFVLPSAKRRSGSSPSAFNGRSHARSSSKGENKGSTPVNQTVAQAHATPSGVDLTETVKTLLHLSQEHGYLTYDDINDVLPENLSPEDLDSLFSKLRSLDVEIVDQKEVERTAAKQPEQEEVDDDARLEIRQVP